MTDATGTTSYRYDALYRLTQASYPNGDIVVHGCDSGDIRHVRVA